MNLDKARQIVIAINKDIKLVGISDQEVSKAFEVSNMAGDFYFDNELYINFCEVRK